MDSNNQPITESDSLETQADPTTTQTGVVSAPSQSAPTTTPTDSPDKGPKESKAKKLLDKVNVYTALLIIILVLLGGGSYYAIVQNRKSSKDTALNTQKLTQDALDKLASTDSTVGDPKQTLSIESNAIFAGGVIIRGNVDVAGLLKIGGPLSLPGLTVGGTTSLDAAAVKSLTDTGDASFQGKVTIQNGISVTGSASFSGTLSASQISADTLLLSKDLQLTSHITASGGAPGHTNGSALGGGGTVSNSGSDTAGTIAVNTGNSAPAGCFVTINFTRAYASIPHVIISPSSSSAGSIDYYVNRSANNFSLCTASDPPDNSAGITFDYVVIG